LQVRLFGFGGVASYARTGRIRWPAELQGLVGTGTPPLLDDDDDDEDDDDDDDDDASVPASVAGGSLPP